MDLYAGMVNDTLPAAITRRCDPDYRMKMMAMIPAPLTVP
jgi:hypothetical protein